MLAYCRTHNKLEAYEPFFRQWTDEEFCNYGLTICHMTDKMMMSFMQKLEHEFVTEGGIKERMYRARTGYRQQQDERLKQLEQQLQEALQETAKWKAEAQKWQAANENLKQRALKAYYEQQDEIKRLKEELSKKI